MAISISTPQNLEKFGLRSRDATGKARSLDLLPDLPRGSVCFDGLL
jgi:hypothetical protein